MANAVIGAIFATLVLGMLGATVALLAKEHNDFKRRPVPLGPAVHIPQLHTCERCGADVAGELDHPSYPNHPAAIWATHDGQTHCLCRATCAVDYVHEWEAQNAASSVGQRMM
ncbi:hypothetical protein [Nocardia sp. NPDC051463]|uniref:hypothetical protein n=1 Tax=Nocardia sp. NPDC051463 TaxID=3154845 RepID=UPI00344DDDF2